MEMEILRLAIILPRYPRERSNGGLSSQDDSRKVYPQSRKIIILHLVSVLVVVLFFSFFFHINTVYFLITLRCVYIYRERSIIIVDTRMYGRRNFDLPTRSQLLSSHARIDTIAPRDTQTREQENVQTDMHSRLLGREVTQDSTYDSYPIKDGISLSSAAFLFIRVEKRRQRKRGRTKHRNVRASSIE